MFVALQMEPIRHERAVLRFLDRLRPARLHFELMEVMGGRWLLLKWSGARLPKWEEIEAFCAHHRGRVLLPEGFVLPGGVELAAPKCARFERAVLLATACEIASRSRMPLYRRVLGLFDPDGALAELMPVLLRHFSCIKVATDAVRLYARESERMMRELGAPVLVGCEPASFGDCMLVLAGDVSAGIPDIPRVPVLCTRGFPGGSPCVTSLRITPPDAVLAALPPGHSAHEFAGALYEFSGVEDMNLVASSMLCDYRQAELTEVVRLVIDSAALRK